MGALAVILQILLLLVGMFMILIILLQRGRGGGLAGAFGGTGGQSAFGTKAGDIFTRITVVVATIWVLLAGFSGIAMRRSADSYADRFGAGETGIESADDARKSDESKEEESSIPAAPGGLELPPVKPEKEGESEATKTPPATPEKTTPPAEGAPATEGESKPAEETKPATEAPADAKPAEGKDEAKAPEPESAPASEKPAETTPESSAPAPAESTEGNQ